MEVYRKALLSHASFYFLRCIQLLSDTALVSLSAPVSHRDSSQVGLRVGAAVILAPERKAGLPLGPHVLCVV